MGRLSLELVPNHLSFLLVWFLTQAALFLILRRRSATSPQHVLLVESGIWFLLSIYLLGFSLALAKQLTLQNLHFISSGFAVLLGLLALRGSPQSSAPQPSEREPIAVQVVSGFVGLLSLVYVAVLVLKAVVIGDTSADGLWYHIPRLFALLQQHGLDPIGLPHIDNYHPKEASFWFLWVMSFYGNISALQLALLPYLLLCVVSVYSLSRAFGSRASSARIAALTSILIPVIAAQFGTALIDIFQLAPLLAAIALLYAEHPSSSVWRVLRFAAALGLLLASKLSGLPYALVLLVAFSLIEWRAARPLASIFVSSVVAGTIAVVLGGYTYVGNYQEHANPFYPQSVDVLGVHLPGPGTSELMWENKQARGLSLLECFIKSWTTPGEVGYGAALGGFGVTGPFLLLCLITWVINKGGGHRKFSLALLCIALLLVTPFPYVPRFTLFVPAIGAVALASLLDERKHVWNLPVFGGAVLVVAVFSILQQLRAIGFQASHNPHAKMYSCEGDSFPAGYSEAFAWLREHPADVLVVSRLEPVANACFWNADSSNKVSFLFAESEQVTAAAILKRASTERINTVLIPVWATGVTVELVASKGATMLLSNEFVSLVTLN